MTFQGESLVYEPPDNNPNSGGGPIRCASGALVPANAGNTVYRSPHAVVPDAEPGGARISALDTMKFLPDGRLVPQDALGAFGSSGSRSLFGDPLIWTPGSIDALKNEVNTLIIGLNADEVVGYASGKLGAAIHAQWGAFMDEWNKYRDGIGFFSLLTGSTATTLQSYRTRANAWRTTLQTAGAAITGPPPSGTGIDKGLGTLGWIGLAAVVAGASYVGYRIYKSYSPAGVAMRTLAPSSQAIAGWGCACP